MSAPSPLAEHYFDRAQDAASCGDWDEYLRWMFKHDDEVRDDQEPQRERGDG